MAIDSKHPLYTEYIQDWLVMRDTYGGERKVKQKRTAYLPATSGQIADGMGAEQAGRKAYDAYLIRSVFHNFVEDAVEAAIGVMHHKPPVIEVPKQLEPLLEKATLDGESLEQLLRKINEQQLVTGRLGLLLDLPNEVSTEVVPYIAMYNAESIINWDNGSRAQPVLQNLNLVVLDETESVRDSDFEWEEKEKYRVLVLGDPTENEGDDAKAVYRVGVFEADSGTLSFNESVLIEPSVRGQKLNEIPFVFVNSKDIVPDPDNPPLIGLAKLALAVYRGEADYRQSLFMQGQDTLVVIGGGEENHRVGANAVLNIPAGGDAKYVGVSSTGLVEMRESLQNDKGRAAQMGGQILDTSSRERESGDALKIRVAAQSATLNQIALSGAEALQTILRHAAIWIGADPEKVNVTPNLDFVDEELTGKTLIEYMSAKALGAPMSIETVHRLMRERGITELELEEELRLINEEVPLIGDDGIGEDEDDPEEDEDPQEDTDDEDV
jgi:hypothetical protein